MVDVSPETLIRTLVRARALESELARLRPEGLPETLRGALPVSPGVQAALVAAPDEGRPADVLCLRRASPAAALSLGVSPVALAHEALGSGEAASGGRSPSGVPDDPAAGLLGAVDPPGTMVEVMAGVALAFRLRREPRVAILVDDADASASGYWHEGLNFAAVQRAPLVLVVDGSRRHALTARVDRLSARAPAYGIRAVTLEGDDPRLVFEAISHAASRARGGDGTQLVEVVPGAPGDPVDRLARLVPGIAEGLDELRREAEAEARSAAETARAARPPDAPHERPFSPPSHPRDSLETTS